tara:strand:+ start:364 stop:657 length:294 start_codon:yes stop_codon:yes gene_type:complete
MESVSPYHFKKNTLNTSAIYSQCSLAHTLEALNFSHSVCVFYYPLISTLTVIKKSRRATGLVQFQKKTFYGFFFSFFSFLGFFSFFSFLGFFSFFHF